MRKWLAALLRRLLSMLEVEPDVTAPIPEEWPQVPLSVIAEADRTASSDLDKGSESASFVDPMESPFPDIAYEEDVGRGQLPMELCSDPAAVAAVDPATAADPEAVTHAEAAVEEPETVPIAAIAPTPPKEDAPMPTSPPKSSPPSPKKTSYPPSHIPFRMPEAYARAMLPSHLFQGSQFRRDAQPYAPPQPNLPFPVMQGAPFQRPGIVTAPPISGAMQRWPAQPSKINAFP